MLHSQATVSPVTIMSDYFSNNYFLKAGDLFFFQIICFLLLCYCKFKFFIWGILSTFPFLNTKFLNGKNFSYSSLSPMRPTWGLAHIDAE